MKQSSAKTDFKGKAKRLDDIDLPKIGAIIDVGEDELHAFMDVETAGSGFDNQGRPKMLFEPHKFYRNLRKVDRDQAVKLGLAYRKWGEKPYPRDSYPRLAKAMEIDEHAALCSASWGLGQILGINCTQVGYPTVWSMVQAFMDDEENHLQAIVEYLIFNDLDDDLRNHDWKGVARGYNGPAYAKHGYHIKMAAAFEKWAKIRDTPFETEILPTQEPMPAIGTRKKDMAEIHLRNSGSRTIKNSDFGQRVAGAGAIISTISVAAQETTGILENIPYWLWPVLVIAGCAGIYWYMRKIKQARVSDHMRGLHKGRQEDQEFIGENL